MSDEWETLAMRDGLPQIPSEWWDEKGIHIVGRCEGPIRNVANRGTSVQRGSGEATIFPVPVQTQFVMVVEDGTLRMEAFDPERHGGWDDIPLMETSPPELLEQLFGDSGTEEISEGQQFSGVRKSFASREHWPARHHPKPRRG